MAQTAYNMCVCGFAPHSCNTKIASLRLAISHTPQTLGETHEESAHEKRVIPKNI